MTDEVRNKINEIIMKDLNDIDSMAPDSPERTAAVKNIETLAKLESYDYEVAAKAYKDEELVRTEKQKMWFGAGTTVLTCAAAVGTTALAIMADHKGWFPSNLGMKTAIKPKLF